MTQLHTHRHVGQRQRMVRQRSTWSTMPRNRGVYGGEDTAGEVVMHQVVPRHDGTPISTYVIMIYITAVVQQQVRSVTCRVLPLPPPPK